MAVGVVVEQPVAEPQHAVEAEVARAAAPRCRRATAAGLRLGLSRHCSVVTTSPVPSVSIAPPSRIQSGLSTASPRVAASSAPIVWSPSIWYLPPQPLKPKRRATRAAAVEHHQRPGVAQPDVAVGVPLERDRAADQRARARLVGRVAHHQPHLLPALGDRVGEGGDLLLRRLEIASATSSASCGKPIHSQSCGAHSGGMRTRSCVSSRRRRRSSCRGCARNSSPAYQFGQLAVSASMRPRR